ncbi:hypothetical protein BDZ89DRAFT_1065413 [Hymenopellis radicata]|nr:hypothetical protein BDZ89DRAFT_1065413 [Hymenopellis radicata]
MTTSIGALDTQSYRLGAVTLGNGGWGDASHLHLASVRHPGSIGLPSAAALNQRMAMLIWIFHSRHKPWR